MARKKLNEVTDMGGSTLEAGTHVVTITGIEEATSKNGNPMYKLTYTNDDGVVWDRLTMTEKAMGFVKRILKACNYDIDDLEYEENKGVVTALYYNNQLYPLENLLQDEKIQVTIKQRTGEFTDPLTGDIKQEQGVEVVDIQPVEEDE